MSFTGTLANVNAALNGLSYRGSPDFNGSDTLSITVDDLGNSGAGGPLSSSQSVAITLNPINDAPTILLTAAQMIAEDTPLVFSVANGNAISVADLDAGNGIVQVSLAASNGSLSLAGTANLVLIAGTGFADASITVQGTVGAINVALNGLVYLPNSNFNGAASIDVSVEDLGNVGGGGNLSMSQSIAIAVQSVNDAPSGLIRTPALTLIEGSAANVSAGTIVAIDPDDATGFAFSLLDDAGHFRIDPRSGAVTVVGANLPAYDVQSSYTIVVHVSDPNGASIDRSFVIAAVRDATVVSTPPTVQVGAPVTTAAQPAKSDRASPDTAPAESSEQNQARRNTSSAQDSNSERRRAPLQTIGLKSAAILAGETRAKQLVGDTARRAEELTLQIRIGSEEAVTKRFDVRGLFDLLKSSRIRPIDDTALDLIAKLAKVPLPSDSIHWDDERVAVYHVSVETVQMGGVAVSIGLMFYALRAGGLVAAMLTALPAWSSMDPLIVLSKDKGGKAKWYAAADTEIEADELGVRAVIDAGTVQSVAYNSAVFGQST